MAVNCTTSSGLFVAGLLHGMLRGFKLSLERAIELKVVRIQRVGFLYLSGCTAVHRLLSIVER